MSHGYGDSGEAGGGGAPTDAKYILQEAHASLSQAQDLSASANGILKHASGVISTGATTTDLPEGSNLYYTDERVDDRVNALIQDGAGLAWTYDDGLNTLTGNVSLATFDTDDLSEGANLYFTDERVDDRVNALLIAGVALSKSYDDGANTLTLDFDPSVALSVSGIYTFSAAPVMANVSPILEAVDAADNSFANSPSLIWRGKYDSDAGAGVTQATSEWQIYNDMLDTAGDSILRVQSRIGAASFADRITIDDAGNVVIPGDLTVQGDTFQALVGTLEVEDKNILVNKGGTTAAAGDSGLDVEGDAAAVIAALRYSASSATKWTAGDGSTQYNLVGEGSTQTLTNKTLTSALLDTAAILLNQAELRFREASGGGTDYISLKAPAALAANVDYVLPQNGTQGEFLKLGASGQWEWDVASLTIEDHGAGSPVSGVTNLQFNTSEGLTITDETGGVVEIGVGSIAESQITDGSLLARVAGNESISGAWTFTSKPVLNVGTTPADALQLQIDALTGAGQRDSHSLLFSGQAYDGSAHQADWKLFADVDSNAGGSALTFQNRIDAASYATKFKIDDSGMAVMSGSIQLGDSSETDNGTLRWTGTDIEVRKAGAWVSLSSSGLSATGNLHDILRNDDGDADWVSTSALQVNDTGSPTLVIVGGTLRVDVVEEKTSGGGVRINGNVVIN